MMRCLRQGLVFILLVAYPVKAALAAPLHADLIQEGENWGEVRTTAFAIIYPIEYEALSQALVNSYGAKLDAEYARFSTFFDSSLQLPVTVRIYPSPEDYYTLNSVVPRIAENSMYSHVGSREIALIGENIVANLMEWHENVLNSFRYELAIMFVEKLTDRKTPPGLATGVGMYAQDPYIFMPEVISPDASSLFPDQPWNTLWNNPTVHLDQSMRLLSGSIIAYMVDVYGWPEFLVFLNSLATSEGYRQSLSATYGLDLDSLEEQWLKYYPMYFQGRWRAHVLYSFDLSIFEQLVSAGAYNDAETGLREAAVFLEKMGGNEKLAQAQAMIATARVGQEAWGLAAQARQALQRGEYARSLELVEQAEEKYDELGDQRHQAELESYRQWANEALELTQEVQQLSEQLSQGSSSFELAERLAQASERLGQLGDIQRLEQTQMILRDLEARQANRQLDNSMKLLLGVLGLLVIRVFLARWHPSQEARL